MHSLLSRRHQWPPGRRTPIGESVREIVRGDDWDAVSAWAELLWSEYVASTGLSWQQASGRIRQAWESYGVE